MLVNKNLAAELKSRHDAHEKLHVRIMSVLEILGWFAVLGTVAWLVKWISS